jgi:hypothetical protein
MVNANASRKRKAIVAPCASSSSSRPRRRLQPVGSETAAIVEKLQSISDMDGMTESSEDSSSEVESVIELPQPAADSEVPVQCQKSKTMPKKPPGKVYDHIDRYQNNGQITFSCKYCKKSWTMTEESFVKSGSSTTNQMKHVKTKHKKIFLGLQNPGAVNSVIGPMDVFIRKVSAIETQLALNPNVSDELIREAIENFVLTEAEAFTLIESESFLTLLKLCLKCKRDNVFIPKADALRNGIVKRVNKMKVDLKSAIAIGSSAVHLCLDMWTSPNMYSFLAVTAHYVDSEWKLVERLLLFQDTTDHSGAGMAEIVNKCLQEFDIQDRLKCITMDNASNNDTLASHLEDLLSKSNSEIIWDSQMSRIRCFAHIINLAVKAFLKALGDEEIILDTETLESSSYTNTPSSLLKRLRFVIRKLRSSPEQRKKFLGQCELANVQQLILILDVPTRWNSTYYMIKRAIEVREGFHNWIGTNPEIGKTKMASYQLEPHEWDLLQTVQSVLEKFELATKLISGTKYPTLALVMPLFIELFSYIEAQVSALSPDDPIAIALSKAHEVMSKYYTFTDDSAFYLLSVLLDPRFKNVYLQKKDFDKDYPGLINNTVLNLKKLVKQRSENSGETEKNVKASAVVTQDLNLFVSMFAHCADNAGDMDEVDKYLELRCEDPSVDALEYWKSHAKQFPNLSAVARDILSIPGSSVSVERMFNCGRDVIGLRRHALQPETFSTLMFGKSILKH